MSDTERQSATTRELEIEIQRAMEEINQVPNTGTIDQFTALVNLLMGNPTATKDIETYVQNKDWKSLLQLLKDHNINVSAGALASFINTQDAWDDLQSLAAAFGHPTLGAFN